MLEDLGFSQRQAAFILRAILSELTHTGADETIIASLCANTVPFSHLELSLLGRASLAVPNEHLNLPCRLKRAGSLSTTPCQVWAHPAARPIIAPKRFFFAFVTMCKCIFAWLSVCLPHYTASSMKAGHEDFIQFSTLRTRHRPGR